VVHLPARSHLALDAQQLPTGDSTREPAVTVALATSAFDDGYRLGRDRVFTLAGGDVAVDMAFDRGYPYAQIYAPRGKAFAAIEPMTAPSNALVTGEHPTVAPGERFAATFTVSARRR
jgi:galactose mutarotase-like enzyme